MVELNRLISAEKVLAIMSDSIVMNHYVILDIRPRMDFIRGHLGPAVWIAMDSLEKNVFTIPTSKNIIVYDSTGFASKNAMNFLIKKGYKNIQMLDGGIRLWINNGYFTAVRLVENTAETLSIHQKKISCKHLLELLKDNNQKFQIIDVRSYHDFKDGHIPGAVSIPIKPVNKFVISLAEKFFPKNKPLIVYCKGHTSNVGDNAIDVLLRNNYTAIYYLNDGIEGWMSESYPLEK